MTAITPVTDLLDAWRVFEVDPRDCTTRLMGEFEGANSEIAARFYAMELRYCDEYSLGKSQQLINPVSFLCLNNYTGEGFTV